jgi:hypothetical protein
MATLMVLSVIEMEEYVNVASCAYAEWGIERKRAKKVSSKRIFFMNILAIIEEIGKCYNR